MVGKGMSPEPDIGVLVIVDELERYQAQCDRTFAAQQSLPLTVSKSRKEN